MERRSPTHDASTIIEASTDGGAVFVPLEGGALPPPGVTTYVERRIALPQWLEGRSAVQLRWTVAGDGTGATGTIRLDDISVTGRPRHDLSLPGLTVAPPRPLPDEEVRCSGFALNTGYADAAGARLSWAIDLDADDTADESEVRGSIDPGSIPAGDSAAYEFSFHRAGPGPLTIFAVVASDSDMVSANDTARFRLGVAVAPYSVVVNEIMYDPLPGRAEYVELFNRSGDTINLKAWRLFDDEDDSTAGTIGAGDIFLEPGAYILCSPDTTMRADYPDIPEGALVIGRLRGFSLNNAGDRLILADPAGETIDRLDYLPEWHTPALDITQGRSLERIDAGTGGGPSWNWGTSAGASGGTPGYGNSLTAERVTMDERLRCTPNPFSPDGDGFEDVTLINYRLESGPVIARVRIYDREGRPVRTLTAGGYVTGTGSFAWNGYDDDGRKAPIGVYIILLDAVDASGSEAMSARGVVVVAGRL